MASEARVEEAAPTPPRAPEPVRTIAPPGPGELEQLARGVTPPSIFGDSPTNLRVRELAEHGHAGEVVDALLPHSRSRGVPELLGDAAARLDPQDPRLRETRQTLIRSLQSDALEGHAQQFDPNLRAGTVRGLSSLFNQLEPAERRILHLGTYELTDSVRFSQLTPESRRALVDTALQFRDRPVPGTRDIGNTLLRENQRLTEGGLRPEEMMNLEVDFRSDLVRQMHEAPASSELGRYARLSGAAGAFGRSDSESRELASKLDRGRIQEDLHRAQTSPEFEETVQRTWDRHTGGPQSDLVRRQSDYVRSQDYWDRLRLSPNPTAVLRDGLGTLAALDLDDARSAMGELAARAADEEPGLVARGALEAAPDLQARAMQTAMEGLGTASKDGKQTFKAAKNVVKALSEYNKYAKGTLAEQTMERLQQAERQLTAVSGPAADAERGALRLGLDFVRKADETGKLSALSTAASLTALGLDVARNGAPNTQDWARATSMIKDLTSATGSVPSVAKMFLDKKVIEGSRLLRGMKWLGPAADGLGSFLDARNMVKNFMEGETGKAVGYGLMSAGGAMTSTAGFALLMNEGAAKGAEAVAARAIAMGTMRTAAASTLVGTAVFIAGYAVMRHYEKTPAEKMVQDLGKDLHHDKWYYFKN